MNTSILGDKIIVLWQVLLGGGAIVFSAAFGAWLMGRKWRKKGEQPPSSDQRVTVCAFVAIGSLLLFPAGMGVLYTLSHEGWLVAITLPVAAIVVVCLVIARSLVGGWTRSVKPHIWMVVLLCGITGVVCFGPSFGRMRILGQRVMDGNSLNSIGKGLVIYHDEYDAYPDDLRRLVDFGWPEGLLRSIYGSEKPHKPRSVPYDGPCDHIYIRLPADAPDNLVWVWQPVKYHDNEGGHVLFKDGSVCWMQAERLKAEVARTHKWLESHPSTQP